MAKNKKKKSQTCGWMELSKRREVRDGEETSGEKSKKKKGGKVVPPKGRDVNAGSPIRQIIH